MYRPDPRIVRYMKEYDPDLDAYWDQDRERWRVTRRGLEVITVMNDDRSYRPLDERVLIKLAEGDSHRPGYRGRAARLMQEHNRAIPRKAREAISDLVRQSVKEDWSQIQGNPVVAGWRPS